MSKTTANDTRTNKDMAAALAAEGYRVTVERELSPANKIRTVGVVKDRRGVPGKRDGGLAGSVYAAKEAYREYDKQGRNPVIRLSACAGFGFGG